MNWKSLFIVFLLLTCVGSAQVVHRHELAQNIRLEAGPNQAFLIFSFRNLGRAPLTLNLPAGMKFHGAVEPCLPVYLGRNIKVSLKPGESKRYRAEALNLYFFPHTAGDYTASEPFPEERALIKKIQKVWKDHRQQRLRHSPMRLTQLLAYFESGADQAKIRKAFRPAEINEASRYR